GLSFKVGTDDLRESPTAELIEMLIGKGYEVAIYDEDVSLSRLHGSNLRNIDHPIPHISRLMRESMDDAITGSEVVVVAKRSSEIEERLTRIGNSHIVIDLVKSANSHVVQNGQNFEGICW